MDVEGLTAVVTGAAIGTGRAIALTLADRGADLVAVDVDAAGAAETGRLAGGRSHCLDVTDAAEFDGLLHAIAPRVLVNNAGGGGHVPPHFPDASRDDWERLVTLNLLAPMRATQAVLPAMRAAGGGVVVNIASSAGLGLGPYGSPEYGAAKAGLIRFTSTLTDLGSVRVNCLVPDWVATERLTAAELATRPAPIPLADVAGATLRLIEDDTLSGRVLVLDREAPPRLLA